MTSYERQGQRAKGGDLQDDYTACDDEDIHRIGDLYKYIFINIQALPTVQPRKNPHSVCSFAR